MQLFNVLGEQFSIDPSGWRQCLAAARQAGWQPAGTRHQPRTLGEDQPVPEPTAGTYDYPAGQEVARSDAQALGQALARGLAGAVADPGLRKYADDLALFCQRGGFVICADVPLELHVPRQKFEIPAAQIGPASRWRVGPVSSDETVFADSMRKLAQWLTPQSAPLGPLPTTQDSRTETRERAAP